MPWVQWSFGATIDGLVLMELEDEYGNTWEQTMLPDGAFEMLRGLAGAIQDASAGTQMRERE